MKNETVMQRLERQREELRTEMMVREQKNKEAKSEIRGMLFVVPVLFALLMGFYFGLWAIVPPAWW